MRVTVRYFAVVRERLGLGEETVELAAGAGLETLRAALLARRPALAELWPHLRVAVDGEFTRGDAPLHDGAEVALIPPVSGGSGGGPFRVQEAPLPVEEAVAAVAHAGAGAIDVFVGVVRGTSRGRDVVALEYEAYATMAEAQFARFAAEVAARWPGTRTAILHRVGRLAVGERSVVIAVASPHRAAAFEACRHVIERLKEDAPIWKREVYGDGAVWVGWGS